MNAQSRIAVMVACDHPIMRDGLRLRIQQESDMYVVCEAGDLPQVLHDLPRCRPDVLVIDLHLPRGAGARAMRTIRGHSPMAPLVFLTDYPGEIPQPRGRGATVAVPKLLANEQIIPAIHKAIAHARGR